MTLSEARQWVLYIQKRGSLNPARHLEWGFSLLASLLCVSGNIKIGDKKPTQKTFMPYSFPLVVENKDATIEDVFSLFQSLKKNGK